MRVLDSTDKRETTGTLPFLRTFIRKGSALRTLIVVTDKWLCTDENCENTNKLQELLQNSA